MIEDGSRRWDKPLAWEDRANLRHAIRFYYPTQQYFLNIFVIACFRLQQSSTNVLSQVPSQLCKYHMLLLPNNRRFLPANPSTCKHLKSENFIFACCTHLRIILPCTAGTRISTYYTSTILTRGIIDFLLVPWNGPLFLTKKVKLSRSALFGFNAMIFWMNIPAHPPCVSRLLPFCPAGPRSAAALLVHAPISDWHPLSARFAFPPVVFSSKYRTSRYSVVEVTKGKGPGREVRVGRVSTNVWTQPEADHRKHLLVDKPSLALPRKFLDDELSTMYIIVCDIYAIPKRALLILIRYSLANMELFYPPKKF